VEGLEKWKGGRVGLTINHQLLKIGSRKWEVGSI
jgi:hypothetical protein